MPNHSDAAPDLAALTFTKLAHLSYQGELKPYLDTICASIIDLLGDGIAAVNFYKENKKFVLAVFPPEIHRKEALDVHGYLSTYVVNHKHTLTVEDASLTPQFGTPPDGFCSYLGVPLRLPGGQVVGTLCYLALDYLKKTQDPKAAKRAVLAANEVKRLENPLNEVLLYAKPVRLNLRPLALSPWLDDFLMTYASFAEQTGVRFHHDKLAPATVMADPDKLTQVCLNLLRNACDAAPARSMIHWTSGLDGNNGIISVHNGGDAMPKAKLRHITEPFISAKAGGSGLELAIVKSIMSAHRGALGIDSAPDAGTTVTLRLPLTAS